MMITIDILPDGNVRCLHTDAIPLQEIGTMTVKRASTVEFNEREQEWEVRVPIRNVSNRSVCLFSDASRKVCLDWEREHWKELV